MNTYKGIGNRVQWTNGTGSDVSSGDVVDLGDIYGIALLDIANAATGVLMIDGEHVLTATTASAWAIGDDVYWDSSNEALIETGGSSYKYIGKATRAKTATSDTTNRIKLNFGAPISPELLDKVWEACAADKTLDIQDIGKVMNITADAKTITLPATVTHYEYIIRNGGSDAAVLVTVSPNANDKIMGADLAGVDNKDRLNTKATAKRGDFIRIVGEGTHGWYVLSEKGTWAAQA